MASVYSMVALGSAAVYYTYRYWWGSDEATETPSKKPEKYYQDLLHRHVGGRREVPCRYGFIDVLTDDTIYEVKNWNAYKNVIGQLTGYETCFRGRKKVAVLFGRPYRDRRKKADIVRLLKDNRIEVWMYDDNDILFEL